MRGRGLSEDNTGVKPQCGLHECCRDKSLEVRRFEGIIQDFGRGATEDLNHPDLEEEKEDAGEVEGVMRSVGVDGDEPAEDSHEDLLDMELEAEGGGEAMEQAKQGRDLLLWAFSLPFLLLRSSSGHWTSTRRVSKRWHILLDIEMLVEGLLSRSSFETGKRGPCMLLSTAENGTERESSKIGPGKCGLKYGREGVLVGDLEGEEWIIRFITS
jgi:hypothetical protein